MDCQDLVFTNLKSIAEKKATQEFYKDSSSNGSMY